MLKKSEHKENFINKFKQNIVLGRQKIRKIYDFLRNKTMNDLVSDEEFTLLEQFQNWLLETLQYGFLLSIIYNTFLGWQGWLNIPLVISLGLVRWIVFDSISEYRKND
jgi:hypothetical protein